MTQAASPAAAGRAPDSDDRSARAAALASGVIADLVGLEAAILAIAPLTLASGGIAAAMMREPSR